jgi:phosphotransferase system enzyme I (PtsP)
LEVGAMMETPSLAFAPDAFFDEVDFISIGGNDLKQFFFAADRDNVRVAERYDPLHPAAVSMLKDIADGCHRNNVPASVCGSLAGRPLEAMVLVAIGYNTLSMPAIGIGPVKSALLALNAEKLAAYIKPLISRDSRLSSIRESVRKFCLDEGIPI